MHLAEGFWVVLVLGFMASEWDLNEGVYLPSNFRGLVAAVLLLRSLCIRLSLTSCDRLTTEGEVEQDSLIRVFYNDARAANSQPANSCRCCQCSWTVSPNQGSRPHCTSSLLCTSGGLCTRRSIHVAVY